MHSCWWFHAQGLPIRTADISHMDAIIQRSSKPPPLLSGYAADPTDEVAIRLALLGFEAELAAGTEVRGRRPGGGGGGRGGGVSEVLRQLDYNPSGLPLHHSL